MIDPDYDYLYDPQQAPVYGRCSKCGGEIYTKGYDTCVYCDYINNNEDDWKEEWEEEWEEEI